MTTSVLARLSWLLAALLIGATAIGLGIGFDLFAAAPEPAATTDFVDRILMFREHDIAVAPFALLSAALFAAAFFVLALLAPAIRGLVDEAHPLRNSVATSLLVAGVLGVGGQLMHAAVAQEATMAYCDCGYRVEEVIGQAKALDIAGRAALWLDMGALLVASVGLVLVGRAVTAVGAGWQTLSYAAAGLAVAAVALRMFGQDFVADLVTGLVGGIAVPAWAIALALHLGREPRLVVAEVGAASG